MILNIFDVSLDIDRVTAAPQCSSVAIRIAFRFGGSVTVRTIAVMDQTNWRVQELIIPLRWSQRRSPQTATLAARITSSATTVSFGQLL